MRLSEQQAALVAEGAARASSETTLNCIGLSAFAILGGAATLIVLVVSIVRPLASLR